MNRIRINSTEGKSLLIPGGTMNDIVPLLPGRGLFIITDTNVSKLYGNSFPAGVVLTVEAGERSKTMETVEGLCRKLLDAGADRSSFILGFGGGVVCDIAGMVASVYM
ncbi:3-dehydroquinate synthase, partial [bacterium]|nr:3-dehydroquinate synthase [bacterium]